MSDPRQFSPDELAGPIDVWEQVALSDLADRLIRQCPAPHEAFLGELRAHLRERRSRDLHRAPLRWAWQRVGALALCGGGLLGLVGLGLAGAGPFAG
jgi:hypothetical protein